MTQQKKVKNKIRKVFCRKCKQVTRHSLLNHAEVKEWWEEIGEGQSFDYFTLQCLGCETVCLLEEYFYSEDMDPFTGKQEPRTTLYPSPFVKRVKVEKSYHLPDVVNKVYLECVKALNSELLILGAIAIRVVIEAICRDKKIKGANLKQKIDTLVDKGFMTKDGAKLLHLTRIVGNFSAHEMKKHKFEDLEVCLDIVETVLQNIYILPTEAKKMSSVPNK